MTSLIEAKSKVRQLSQKALDTVDSPSLNNTQKKAALGKIESEIKHWVDEVQQLEGVADRSRAMYRALGDMGSSYETRAYGQGDGLAAGSHLYGQKALSGPPSLAVSEEDAHDLYLAAKSGQSLKVELKTTSTNASLGGAPPQFIPGFSEFRREPTRIADLMPSAAATSSSVDYYVLSGSTNAATVAEGALKPESTVGATLRSLPMAKIATWAKATSEALSDFPAFMSVLTGDLMAGVVLAESGQVLNGDGTGVNMTGILNTTGLLTQTTAAGTDPLLALSTAITTLRTGSSFVAQPTGIVLNPTDLNKIRMLKSTTGEYLAGNPFESGPTAVWGIPVTTTTAIAVGTALVADFASLGVVYVREGLNVRIDPYTLSTSNITQVIAEERLAVAVVRPSAGIKITGLNS